MLRRPVTHDFSNTAATSAHLSCTSRGQHRRFLDRSIAGFSYLLLLRRVVVPVYTCQCLRVPPKLVVACVCVDDSGAVVASRDFGSAFWVGLGGAEGE